MALAQRLNSYRFKGRPGRKLFQTERSSALVFRGPSAGEKIPISQGDALTEGNLRGPAQRLEPADIQEFARRAVRLAGILDQLAAMTFLRSPVIRLITTSGVASSRKISPIN